ncbi:uncharacterized protein A1O9_04428 [Exophiala aquamarina CBS 119918]|uniref:Methyltransferase domain-containing protein n=1 Tax=Exophiala aquamarina CBS 119918 TaxID=1182545 RepID=A0A072PJT3_9EURO|nr:uncharacterized protein A1O9_04428 [Exophiala aquamarina CBS 119918]KEF59583.1 hypothetical protein A1O9_04428 [Exophiala aquamarina CBS 119918]
MSVSSEVTRYRVENYRRYHAFDQEKYFQPNDAQAQEHEGNIPAKSHKLCLTTFDDALFLAPLVDYIQKVLDVGTGTGLWAEAFAEEFPSAQVLGTDLSPIQTSWPVVNYKFEIDDAEQDWTFSENSFDYIHIRGLLGCVQNWAKLYAQCY